MRHHTKDKGDVGLGLVISDLLSRGIQIALPISEHLPFDCIGIHEDGSMARIQVRYRAALNGRIKVELNSTWYDSKGSHKKNRGSDSYDILAVYCPDTRACYYLREKDLGKTGVNLRLTEPKNNQTLGVRIASDFTDPINVWPMH